MVEITTYKELNHYFEAFGSGKISFLIVKSVGGLGKSHTVKELFKDKRVLYFGGHATPLSIYNNLCRGRNRVLPVVFDDVDTLMANKSNVALLKQLCELGTEKKVRYSSSQTRFDLPEMFVSRNQVCLLCNELKTKNKDITALITRAIFVEFNPTPVEILNKIRLGVGLDKDLLNFFENNLDWIEHLSLRLFYKCQELKFAGLDWEAYIEQGGD